MSRINSEDFRSLAEFRYLLRKFLRFSKDFLRESAGLNPEQYEALLAIRAFERKDGVTISELSERLQIKHHSAVNIVDRLVEKKLIIRSAGESDRRRRHLSLTSKGEQVIASLAGIHRKELRGRSPDMIKAVGQMRERVL